MALLMSHAWAIVDAAHVARQLILALGQSKSEDLQVFLVHSSKARTLRNKMDHIHQNAGNFSAAKHMPPVYGALSYILAPHRRLSTDGSAVEVEAGGMIMIAPGSLDEGGRISLTPYDPRDVNHPVHRLQLTAFGENVFLSDLVRDHVEAVIAFDERAGKSLLDQAMAHSQNTGIEVEKMMGHGPSHVTMFLGFAAPDEQKAP